MRQNQNEQAFIFNLSSGQQINIYCWGAYGGSVGFQHRCNVVVKNQWLDKFYKVQYYNRTWECFRYESLLYHTIAMLSKEKHITKEEKEEISKKINSLSKENYSLTYKLQVIL